MIAVQEQVRCKSYDLDGCYVMDAKKLEDEARFEVQKMGKSQGSRLSFAGWDIRFHPGGNVYLVGWGRSKLHPGSQFSTEKILL